MSDVIPHAGQMLPGVSVRDPLVAWWMQQVNVRLRREICWLWRQRADRADPGDGSLPPPGAPAESLDIVRFAEAKARFFEEDETAAYLSDLLDAPLPESSAPATRGSWTWIRDELELNDAEQFVMALALVHRLDSSTGAVFASCMNDQSRPYPTVALAQRLWSRPNDVVECADPRHMLYRTGILRQSSRSEPGLDWHQPLVMPASIARTIAHGEPKSGTGSADFLVAAARDLDPVAAILASDLAGNDHSDLRVVPLIGVRGSDYSVWAAALGKQRGRAIRRINLADANSPSALSVLLSDAWLHGTDVLMPDNWIDNASGSDKAALASILTSRAGLPIVVYAPCESRSFLNPLPQELFSRPFEIPSTTYEQRLDAWRTALGGDADRLSVEVEECSRRFRLPEQALQRVIGAVRKQRSIDAQTLFDVCRSETQGQLGDLAQAVTPRFEIDELVLPLEQENQFNEVITAMNSLTQVHYRWGTAQAWNEAGLAVLFAGPPGTGKTMGAEVLANALALDLYRIDLSQVVNKYIGETEKNLRRIFDAAEAGDCVLFFDEADALFGKRTDVKDAHDRFANIEISYLLERMERFKGLAILATNRRKDLDEAFMRRLRYIIEFPMPGREEREKIWRQSFPEEVDTSDLDFRYLAKQFSFSGGHIRSVSFNACLQSAGQPDRPAPPKGKTGVVTMEDVLLQLKRELQKMNRAASDDQFGHYAKLVQESVA
jgi:vesicle-fusing ATPase